MGRAGDGEQQREKLGMPVMLMIHPLDLRGH
jgi:hypothetical protein